MSDFLARALELLDQGDGDAALAVLYGGLGDPDMDPVLRGEASGLLADLMAERGDALAAASHYAQALLADPDRRSWRRGHVNALMQLADREAARAACETLLALRPDDATGHRHMAFLTLEAGDRAKALDHAREVLFLAPRDLGLLAAIADVLVRADEPLMAVEALETALRKAHPADPDLAPAAVAQARAWIALGEPKKAEKSLRLALDNDPDDRTGAGALLEGLSAGADSQTLPPAFVRALFDTYADRFDRELVGKLRYDAPSALRALLDAEKIGPGLDVMDAGCGTGLAGVVLRDLAATLAGFDLSPRMVERARARGLYDDLWVGEFVAGLSTRPEGCDLLVAADVLVYLGDLGPVMQAAALALRPGGWFAFTCEAAADPDGFLLHEGRRFAHGDGHIRASAAAAGLQVQVLRAHSSRHDRGRPVPGWISLCHKPA